MLFAIAYLTYGLASMVSADIHGQYLVEIELQSAKVQRCTQEYFINRCEPHERVRALEDYCQERELCMNTPISATIKTTKNVLNLIGQAVNSFTEPLEYGSYGLVCLLLFLVFKYGGKCVAKLAQYRSNNTNPSLQPVQQQIMTPSKIEITLKQREKEDSTQSNYVVRPKSTNLSIPIKRGNRK